jgi:hypothetical protein
LTTLDGDNQESFVVAAKNAATTPPTITACFTKEHAAGTVLVPLGSFATGIIPDVGFTNGSTDSVLKMYGDINGDGNMVYVEYTCDLPQGLLLRNMMAYDAVAKPALTVEQILLDNLRPNPPNPDGTVPPCFTYQESTFAGTTYVIGVAIMTTVRTQDRERMTNDFQVVTKALLNVSPRNVVNVWQLASLGHSNRVQPLPPSVLALLP